MLFSQDQVLERSAGQRQPHTGRKERRSKSNHWWSCRCQPLTAFLLIFTAHNWEWRWPWKLSWYESLDYGSQADRRTFPSNMEWPRHHYYKENNQWWFVSQSYPSQGAMYPNMDWFQIRELQKSWYPFWHLPIIIPKCPTRSNQNFRKIPLFSNILTNLILRAGDGKSYWKYLST
jgi:hypothetical protein